jgi:adenylosuccinate lyase
MQTLEQIWGEQFWTDEAIRIELCYWGLIKDKVPNISSPDMPLATEHRIEKFVRGLSYDTGIGNLHVGLTSSDLEDNIRAKRLEESLDIMNDKTMEMLDAVREMFKEKTDNTWIAYTHLVPAGTISVRHRFSTYRFPKSNNVKIEYKGIGGALGDGKIQKMLGIGLDAINASVFPDKKCQQACSQTVDHYTEFDTAAYIVLMAASLAKFANDMRQMFAFSQVRHTHKDIGSTAIPAKKPNPWRYERASGMAEQLYDMPSKVARVLSSCLLERTLTNQSVLNRMFCEGFMVLEDMFNDIIDAVKVTEIVDQTKLCKNKNLHSEEQLLKLVLKGQPRLKAHLKINGKN